MKKLIAAISLSLIAGCSVAGCSAGSTKHPAPSAAPSPTPSVVSSPSVNSAGAVTASAAGSATPPASGSSDTTPVPGATQAAVPPEKNPPGDIPDNLAFVPYSNPAGHYTFSHPEGWAQTTTGDGAVFTDKLNGVSVAQGVDATPPTVDVANQRDVAALSHSQAAFELRNVSAVTEPGGQGVRIVYRRNSAPDPVTGRQYRDEVERYELVSNGRAVVMELFGPVGADNVDAYHTMVQSLRLQ